MAVGAGALGALGAGVAISAMRDSYEKAAADVRQQTAAARTEFDDWNAKLQAQFPDGKLDTPQDHGALDELLRENPAPEWLHVEHERFTDVHTRPGSFIDWPSQLTSETPGAGLGIALSGAVGGAIAIGHGVARGGSNLSTAAKILGGVAALSVGAIAGYTDIGPEQVDTSEAERAKLTADATLPR